MGCPTVCELGDNLVFSVCTHDPDTGVLTDADSVPTYHVYEDETGTAIDSGSMAKLDDANTTGFYTELLAVTTGNGYEDGKTYTIYIEAIVDSDKGGICYAFKVGVVVGLTAGAVADAVLDELLEDHLNQGSLGRYIDDLPDEVWEKSHVEHMKPGTFGAHLDMPISVIPGAEKQRRGD